MQMRQEDNIVSHVVDQIKCTTVEIYFFSVYPDERGNPSENLEHYKS